MNKKERIKASFMEQMVAYQEVFADFREINKLIKSGNAIKLKFLKTLEAHIDMLSEDIEAYTKKYYTEPRFIYGLKELEYTLLNLLEIKAKERCSRKFYQKLFEIIKKLAFKARLQTSIISGYDKEYVFKKRKEFQHNQLVRYSNDIAGCLIEFSVSLENSGQIDNDPKVLKFFKTTCHLVFFALKYENEINEKVKQRLLKNATDMENIVKYYVHEHKAEYDKNFAKFSWIGIMNYYSKELELVASEKISR